MTLTENPPANEVTEPEPATPVVDPAPPEAADEEPRRSLWSWLRGFVLRIYADVIAAAAYVGGAFWVTSAMWADPARREPAAMQSDPSLMQWFLAHAVRVVTHGENPLFTNNLNVPEGVNLMANTPMLGLTIPMVPVTMTAGPAVSFVLLVTLGLCLTAFAWYLLLSRALKLNRLAAAIGGWCCGFSGAMLAHASWHPNIIGTFLVPFLVWQVLRLCSPEARVVRDGVILGLLVTYQAFVNEEILLFAALACGLFAVLMALQRPTLILRAWRGLLGGLAVCTAVAGVLLAYPIYFQFFGPQAYGGINIAELGNDLRSFGAFGTSTLAGNGAFNGNIAANLAEENTFYGYPLLIVVAIAVLLLIRVAAVRAITVSALVFAALSLGVVIESNGEAVGPGPWSWLHHLPLADSVVPARFAMIVGALLGVLVAFAVDGLVRVGRRTGRLPLLRGKGVPIGWRVLCWAGVAVVLGALVPNFPIPLEQQHRPAVPGFFTSGAWRQYVRPGETVVPVPLPYNARAESLRWAAATELAFPLPRGYFLGPENGQIGDPATFGPLPDQASLIFERVYRYGVVPELSEQQIRLVRDQLRYWRGGVVVVADSEQNARELRTMVTRVLGPGQSGDGVQFWDIDDGRAVSAGD